MTSTSVGRSASHRAVIDREKDPVEPCRHPVPSRRVGEDLTADESRHEAELVGDCRDDSAFRPLRGQSPTDPQYHVLRPDRHVGARARPLTGADAETTTCRPCPTARKGTRRTGGRCARPSRPRAQHRASGSWCRRSGLRRGRSRAWGSKCGVRRLGPTQPLLREGPGTGSPWFAFIPGRAASAREGIRRERSRCRRLW